MVKKRVPVPYKTVDELLVACKHLCCICERPLVQTHHIDGDPSNNDPDNIIPLCGYCHNLVVSKFGTSRAYTEEQLKMYREKHIEKYSNFPYPNIVSEVEDIKSRLEKMEAYISKVGDSHD